MEIKREGDKVGKNSQKKKPSRLNREMARNEIKEMTVDLLGHG